MCLESRVRRSMLDAKLCVCEGRVERGGWLVYFVVGCYVVLSGLVALFPLDCLPLLAEYIVE